MSELAWIERGGGHWEARAGRLCFELWQAGRHYVLDVNGEQHDAYGSFAAADQAAEELAR